MCARKVGPHVDYAFRLLLLRHYVVRRPDAVESAVVTAGRGVGNGGRTGRHHALTQQMKRGTKKDNAHTKEMKGEVRSRDKEQINTEPRFVASEPVMPDFLKKIPLAVTIWNEYMKMGLGERILTEPDSRTFALYCIMCAEFETMIRTRAIDDPMTPAAAWLAQYRMYAELFGLVPAGRARIQEKPSATINENPNKDKNQSGKDRPQEKPTSSSPPPAQGEDDRTAINDYFN